ncbi:MAG: ribonuclease P protein component [Bacteroidia bacterium]
MKFKKQERLRGRTTFAKLFTKGRSFNLPPFRITWQLLPGIPANEEPVQAAFIVPKRNFKKAVHRNRIRRRMKEAYRLHKKSFRENHLRAGQKLLIAFYYTAREEKEYQEIERKLIVTLQQLAQETRKMNPDSSTSS